MLDNRTKRIHVLRKLVNALGANYDAVYDVCESCQTEIYLKLKNGNAVMVKRFNNDVLDGEISVYEFAAPQSMIAYYYNIGLI